MGLTACPPAEDGAAHGVSPMEDGAAHGMSPRRGWGWSLRVPPWRTGLLTASVCPPTEDGVGP